MFRPRPPRADSPDAVRLAKLTEISKALNSELQLDKLLKLIMDSVIDLTDAERGFIILNHEGSDRIVVARNMDREEVRRPSFKISHSIVERVRESGKATLTNDAQAEKGLSAFASVSDLKLRSVLCVPFRLKDAVIGVLYLDHRFQRGNFREEDLWLIDMLNDHAAIAIENARLHEEISKANRELERLNAELRTKVATQEREIDAIRERLRDREAPASYKYDYRDIIGSSPAMRNVFRLLDRVIDSDLPVIVLGESGTGKELVAQIIHKHGPRRQAPFVSENCGAIPESLMESEIFGFVRGAFTGADRDREGLLEQAHRGTLFLDEIGEMDLSLQKKLLRALQEGEFRKVGSEETISVDVRVISATNRDLHRMVEEGEFRADLFYRLKGVIIDLPPLRERREDIPSLVDHFLAEFARTNDRPVPTLEPGAMDLLCRHSWPGNVRELENEIRCMATLCHDDVIDRPLAASVLGGSGAPQAIGGDDAIRLGSKSMQDLEREIIEKTMRACEGHKSRAAEKLGIPRRTFYDKLKRLEDDE